jgi:hypothetical protein
VPCRYHRTRRFRVGSSPGGPLNVGIFLTNQHPPGTDMVAALEGQYAMTRLARDRGSDAVATGQHYLSDGVSQLQLVPFLPGWPPRRAR